MANHLRFYGYKHWTLEDSPRCFNVGKGVISRPSNKRRNHKWHAIVKRFGLRVEVCTGPVTNEEACVWEINNIDKEGTFSTCHEHDNFDDISCNFTRGGGGSVGYHLSDAQKAKQSVSLRGRTLSESHKNAMKNSNMRSDVKLNRSLAAKQAQKSRYEDPQERVKRSISALAVLARGDFRKGKSQRCGHCNVLGHNKRRCVLLIEEGTDEPVRSTG